MTKIIAILLAGTILSTPSVWAAETVADNAPTQAEVRVRPDRQKPEFSREHHKEMAARMAKDLELTEDQIATAEKLREESRARIEPLMKQMGDIREQIDAERRANMEAFEKILTPEQKARFDQMRKQGPKDGEHRMMRGMHDVGPQGRPDDRGEHMDKAPDHDRGDRFDDRPNPPHKRKHGDFKNDKPEKKGGFIEE